MQSRRKTMESKRCRARSAPLQHACNISRCAVLLAAMAPVAMAQHCISLANSTTCSAFNRSSISTSVSNLFPFLNFVSDTQSFDDRLRSYVSTTYSQVKYQSLLGCSSVNLTNTTGLYARYTTSVICNAIVQNSAQQCSLSGNAARPLCANTCADFAISEQSIAASPDLCGRAGSNAMSQIRADFTNCALPADSLSGECINGVENEPSDCGFQSNLASLCSYCSKSSPNATDSCCSGARVDSRCTNVHLPTTTSMPPLFPSATSSGKPAATGRAGNATAGMSNGVGLSGGQIAGIVVGSILGALLLLAILIGCCILMRRRRNERESYRSVNKTPSMRHATAPVTTVTHSSNSREPEVIPGARVARMSALEAPDHSSRGLGSPGAFGGFARSSSSESYHDSPETQRGGVGLLPKRKGSLSNHSQVDTTEDSSSPKVSDGHEFSSPEGVGSGQSEQLSSFKDYYSQDEIRPGNAVATLWAYQPRANDEFELERGDMLKVIGIWDDGWATGVKLQDRAEDWDARRLENRDSGISNGAQQQGAASSSRPTSSAPPLVQPEDGEIKAFPHWRKTIDGDPGEPASLNPRNPPEA